MDLELSATALALSAESPGHGYVVAALRGECDVTNVHLLREHLLNLLDGQAPRVILDLAGLSFIDASGVNVLIAADLRARELGVTLAVAAARNVVARVLSLTGLDQRLAVYATAAEAVADGQVTR